jgi:hypothetical protein
MEIAKQNSSTYKNLIFYTFLAAYAAIITYLCYKLNVSEDESYTLNTSTKTFAGVIRQSYMFEGQPPLYFLVMKYWRMLNDSVFFARFFSIVCIALSGYVITKLHRLLFNDEYYRWVLVVFLLNPYTVWCGLDTRLYAMLILLAAIAIYCFMQYYMLQSKKHLYLFLLVTLLGLYTQYFFGVLVTGMAAALLVYRGWKALFTFCLYMLPVVLLFLPNLIYLQYQLDMHQPEAGVVYTIQDKISKAFEVLHSPQNLMLSVDEVDYAYINRFVRLALLLVAVVAYIGMYKKARLAEKKYAQHYNVLLIATAVITVIMMALIAWSGIIYNDSYMTVLYPFLILLFSIFIFLGNHISRVITYTSIAVYFIWLLNFLYSVPVNTYDFNGIAGYVRSIEKKNEPILIYRNMLSLPFSYSYNGNNPIVPLPKPVNFDTTFIQHVKDTTELVHVFDNIKTPCDSYIYISDLNKMNRIDIIDTYLVANFITELDTLYVGNSRESPLRIRRIKEKQPR